MTIQDQYTMELADQVKAQLNYFDGLTVRTPDHINNTLLSNELPDLLNGEVFVMTSGDRTVEVHKVQPE